MRALFCAFCFLLLAVPAWAGIPLNPDISQHNIGATIFVSGYTKYVRPPVSYTNKIKKRLMRESGIPLADIHGYELDHIVPLALGGCPDCEDNLQLQPWNGPDGAHKKDRLEVKLQCLVCTGEVTLVDAQNDIYTDWHAAYSKYARMKCHRRRSE
ncbi:MAG TPA: hypothetical protein VKC56_07225 [Gallionellaceae bacterium]|nr:hypothetical protein [Gallionellaceae bacterium]